MTSYEKYQEWAQRCLEKYETHKEEWQAACLERAFMAVWQRGRLVVTRHEEDVLLCRITFPYLHKAPSAYVRKWYEPYYHCRPMDEFMKVEFRSDTSQMPPPTQDTWLVYATCDNLPLLLVMASRFGGKITDWNDAYYERPPVPIPAHEPPAEPHSEQQR